MSRGLDRCNIIDLVKGFDLHVLVQPYWTTKFYSFGQKAERVLSTQHQVGNQSTSTRLALEVEVDGWVD